MSLFNVFKIASQGMTAPAGKARGRVCQPGKCKLDAYRNGQTLSTPRCRFFGTGIKCRVAFKRGAVRPRRR